MKAIVVTSLLAFAQAYLKLDFEKSPKASSDLVKRDDEYVNVPLKNDGDLYLVQSAVGTPPQNITVQLDTGSSDLWFPSADNPFCKENKKYAPKGKDVQPLDDSGYPSASNQVPKSSRTLNCKKYGVFNSSESSTFKRNDSEFLLSYADMSFATGNWGSDVVSFNELNISNVNFALGSFANSSNGVLGVGLPDVESTYDGPYAGSRKNISDSHQYANFPITLKQNGVIDKIAYSLYLNSSKSKFGSVLFGAVDHNRYNGPLYTLPSANSLFQNFTDPFQLEITMNGLGLQGNDANITLYDKKSAALLDSGTTLTVVSKHIGDLIAAQVNGTIAGKDQCIRLPKCPSKKENKKSIFNFSGAEVAVDINQMMNKHKGKCYLQFAVHEDTSNDAIIFGDNFLRSVYLVYNLEDKEISIAPANFNSSLPENIEPIKSTVPSAIRAPQYYNTYSEHATATAVTGDIFAPEATMSMAPINKTNGSSNRTLNSSRFDLQKRVYSNQASLKNSSLIAFFLASLFALAL